MDYNVRISCKDMAMVINFTIEKSSVPTSTLNALFNSIIKENYNAVVSIGCKKHRGAAKSFWEAVSEAKSVRFFKYETVPNIEETKQTIFVLDVKLPYCTIESDEVEWGTFFNIEASKDTCIAPDYNKLCSKFLKAGLDWNVASNGRMYTHNHITFTEMPFDIWRIEKIVTVKKLVDVRKKVML